MSARDRRGDTRAPSPAELRALIRDALADADDALVAGDTATADELARDVLAALPDHAGALTVLGRVALAAGAHEDAQALLRRALTFDPTLSAAHFALAESLAATMQLGEALVSMRQGLAVTPTDPRRWRSLGRLGMRLSFKDEALAAYRRAVELAPDDLELRGELAAAAGMKGHVDESEALLRSIIAAAPDQARAHANLGSALAAAGRREEALVCFQRAVELQPDFVDARANLARCLGVLGRGDEALTAFQQARELAPDDPQIAFDHGRLLLDLRRGADALALVDAFLVNRPGHAGLLALRLLALRALGRHAEADDLAGLDRFVRPMPLPVPRGYASGEAFARAMAAHVKAHPSLAWAPAEHATMAGHHTGSLQVPPLGPIAAFQEAITQALTAYVDALPTDDPHPFVKHRPHEVYFDIWGVVMGRGGHQIPHIHPSGWLSAAYYAELPALGTAEDPQGWFQLGPPDRPLPDDVNFPLRSIEPKLGWVVMFPSYLYHHTVPTATDDTRVSVAFDVLPLG